MVGEAGQSDGRLKKGFMVQIWRVQQSQAIVGILFWSLTLTGVFYSYAAPKFSEVLGIPESDVLVGMVFLFLIVLASIMAFGFLYDRVLRLWREQNVVAYERNPYTRERLIPKEILLWEKLHLRTLREVAKEEPETQEDIDFMERWIEKSMKADPLLRPQVRDLEKWVMEQ